MTNEKNQSFTVEAISVFNYCLDELKLDHKKRDKYLEAQLNLLHSQNDPYFLAYSLNCDGLLANFFKKNCPELESDSYLPLVYLHNLYCEMNEMDVQGLIAYVFGKYKIAHRIEESLLGELDLKRTYPIQCLNRTLSALLDYNRERNIFYFLVPPDRSISPADILKSIAHFYEHDSTGISIEDEDGELEYQDSWGKYTWIVEKIEDVKAPYFQISSTYLPVK